MPIQKQSAEIAFNTTRKAREDSQFLRKEDLLGKLVAFVLRDYDPNHQGKFGVGPRAVVDIVVVGDRGECEDAQERFFANGNLARQFGEVAIGSRGLGRVIKGESSGGGQPWWGLDYTDDEEDIERAQKAVAAAVTF